MRHRHKGKTLDRKRGPRQALIKNLVASVVLYERVTTTTAKAKAIRPYVEKMVTLAKEPTLAHRRLLLSKLPTEGAVKKLIEVLGPKYKSRAGGYTRITRLGRRVGDRAEQALIEFI